MFSYSVAIRTLGKAGEKYLVTLQSVAAQTIPPTNINVYIPYGYDLPKETIGIEKYYRCDKGMISQRALQYDEIKDEWILFLDDDMYLPPDVMQRASDFINSNNVDSLSTNVFLNHKESKKNKIIAACNSVFPMKSNYWGFKVTSNGRFKYNNNPQSNFMHTQTGPGAFIICKKDVFLSIHFEDEIWMDKFGYALGEDQLMNYKIYLKGYNEYIWYNSGVQHLDAGSQNRKLNYIHLKNASACLFLVWHRSIYNLDSNTKLDKLVVLFSFLFSFLLKFIFSFLYIFKGIYNAPIGVVNGIFEGIRYTASIDYKKMQLYDHKY